MAELCKLGDVFLSVVTEENTNFKNNITSFPVEDGSVVSDNVDNQPIKVSLNGVVVGDDAVVKYNRLTQMWRDKEIIKYTGRIIIDNCVIESFTRVANSKIANGFNFTIVIKQIRFAYKESINIDVSKLKIPQIKKKSKKGRQSKSKSKKSEKSILEEIKKNY